MPQTRAFRGQRTKDTLLWLQALLGPEVQPLKDWCSSGQLGNVELSHKDQRFWSNLIHKARKNALLQDSSARDMVRLRCQNSSTASAWSRAPPSTALGTKIARDRFRLMLRWHLGIPILSPTQAGKPCPSCGEALDIFGDHAVTCSRGPLWRRHFLVQDYILRLSRAAGFQATREVSLVGSNRREADILISNWDGLRPLAVDLTIRHPRAPGLPFSDPDRVLLRAEEDKRRGAEAQARASDTIFEPLVLHTWSGVANGGTSKTFLGQWLQRVIENRPGSDKDRKAAEIHEGLSCILFSQIAEQLSGITLSSEIPVVPSCHLPDRIDEFGNALPGVHSVPIERQLRLRARPRTCASAPAAGDLGTNTPQATPASNQPLLSPCVQTVAPSPQPVVQATSLCTNDPLCPPVWMQAPDSWSPLSWIMPDSNTTLNNAGAPAPEAPTLEGNPGSSDCPVDPLLLQILQRALVQ